MGGVALLAREMGYEVSGADTGVYPPMSTQLEQQGIILNEGYDPAKMEKLKPDLVVVGNAMSRGNPCVEFLLEKQLPFTSGPEFVYQHILKNRWVLAVAGTHGKTTTSSMLAWILEYANSKPGFLIGGVPQNFGVSARLGEEPFFVIEADEYDTAFFDKRSKFVHYHPRTLVLNNLEFDHADIFADLEAIKRQFEHLLRIVPQSGKVISDIADANLEDVLARGCWSEQEKADHDGKSGWWTEALKPDASEFVVGFKDKSFGKINWALIGNHNMQNALMAIAAARHAGILPATAFEALGKFINTRRRLEIRGCVNGVTVYDDFAHHPTAIETTLQGLRNKVGEARIFAILEPRSNTMKMGIHKDRLAESLKLADQIFIYQPPDVNWDVKQYLSVIADKSKIFISVEDIIRQTIANVQPGDHVVIMSNGGFENIHERLLEALDT